MNAYYNRIVMYLLNRPMKYIKIDDMRIDLFIHKSNNKFHRAWQDLVANGRLEICGNAVRINQ